MAELAIPRELLAEADLNRVRELIERDAAAQTEVPNEERAYLAQKQKVQGLQNFRIRLRAKA